MCGFMVMLKKLGYFLKHSPEKEAVRFGVNGDYSREMRRALWKYGMFYEEFLLFDCAGKDRAYVSSFITELNRYEIYRKYNDRRVLPLFHDKYRVYQLYHEFYKREVIRVTSGRDRDVFLDFVRRHPKFILKPTDKSCGFGVKIIDSAEKSADELFETVMKSRKCVCEELIPPHPELGKLNPTSLNTVRVVTILEGENVRLFYPFLRVGRYGSPIDNGGAGGILIPVNAVTGELNPVGRDETGRYYPEHPDSHVKFRGIVLPMWEEAVRLTKNLAKICPRNRCIGWDIAAAPDGWVMVEANIRGQFIGQQMCDRVGKKAELL